MLGPPKCVYSKHQQHSCYPLLNPDDDKEVRQEVISKITKSSEGNRSSMSSGFQKFSSLARLTRAVSRLQHIGQSFTGACPCAGWHLCPEASTTENLSKSQNFIVKVYQEDFYPNEVLCLNQETPMPSHSIILPLNPFLDEYGLLRVGGRLKHSSLSVSVKNPIIVPGKSHLALLLIRHFHEKVLHQGRHFTEGAVREGGFWITGGKKKISSYIFTCFQCRRQRWCRQTQIMADLPTDRLTPAPPFTYVGVDVFRPWSILARRTRGGQASSKRWVVLFTCLTTRAIHIEIIEEMSSSAFINALSLFVAIRGNVLEIRSDRGTNVVGDTFDLGIYTVNVEDRHFKYC